jgi:hypothetical protein
MRAVDPFPRALEWIPGVLQMGDRWLTFTGPQWKKMLVSSGQALREGRMEFEGCLEIPWAPGRILSFGKRP